MFGGGSASAAKPDRNASDPEIADKRTGSKSPSPESPAGGASPALVKTRDQAASGEKRSGNGSPPSSGGSAEQKKRRSSGMSGKASSLLSTAKNTLNFAQAGGRFSNEAHSPSQTPLQKLGKHDAALAVPQGQHNNSAGESLPGPRSTFRVGVWEDRNKKCRRTMEDTHAFLYNFLHTPAPVLGSAAAASQRAGRSGQVGVEALRGGSSADGILETDNGYFAIFDGHAGTFAADWCGKKVHIILEDIIRKNPNLPIPELLDQTFTTVDAHLEKLPLKNSGCTAAIAVLRWEDRVPSSQSATGSQAIAPAAARAAEEAAKGEDRTAGNEASTDAESAHARLKATASRQRVLYTANVGDARIILCRSGKALRLSYDHKGSDENEGKRIANAGGLILNNRVNGVLAVTRALGDSYMKDLVTGHPYTTETVVQPETDELIIIACDGLWDVCSDQEAVDLVRNVQDPVSAAKLLVDHALARFSTDNLSCMIIKFDKTVLLENQAHKEPIGVEGDQATSPGRSSEVERIVGSTRQKIAEGCTPAVGVSASNSGKGHGPTSIDGADATFTPTVIEGPVEEEPCISNNDGPKPLPIPLEASAERSGVPP